MKKDALIGRNVIAAIYGKRQEVQVIDKVRTTIKVCGQDEVGDAFLVADKQNDLYTINISDVSKLIPEPPEFELPDFNGNPQERTEQAIVLLEAIYYDDLVDDVWLHETINVLKKRLAALKRKPAGPGLIEVPVSTKKPDDKEVPGKYEPLVEVQWNEVVEGMNVLIDWTDGSQGWYEVKNDQFIGLYVPRKDTQWILEQEEIKQIRRYA